MSRPGILPLLRHSGEPLLDEILAGRGLGRIALRLVLAMTLGAALYGAVFGSWHGPLLALAALAPVAGLFVWCSPRPTPEARTAHNVLYLMHTFLVAMACSGSSPSPKEGSDARAEASSAPTYPTYANLIAGVVWYCDTGPTGRADRPRQSLPQRPPASLACRGGDFLR